MLLYRINMLTLNRILNYFRYKISKDRLNVGIRLKDSTKLDSILFNFFFQLDKIVRFNQ